MESAADAYEDEVDDGDYDEDDYDDGYEDEYADDDYDDYESAREEQPAAY
jgi:hypothetical protein